MKECGRHIVTAVLLPWHFMAAKGEGETPLTLLFKPDFPFYFFKKPLDLLSSKYNRVNEDALGALLKKAFAIFERSWHAQVSSKETSFPLLNISSEIRFTWLFLGK